MEDKRRRKGGREWLKPHQFTPDKQPTREQRVKGHQKRSILKRLANEVIKGAKMEEVSALAKEYGFDIEASQINITLALMLRQIKKAWEDGDTPAFNAIMDRLHGKPVQQTVNKHEFDLSQRKGLGWDEEE